MTKAEELREAIKAARADWNARDAGIGYACGCQSHKVLIDKSEEAADRLDALEAELAATKERAVPERELRTAMNAGASAIAFLVEKGWHHRSGVHSGKQRALQLASLLRNVARDPVIATAEQAREKAAREEEE